MKVETLPSVNDVLFCFEAMNQQFVLIDFFPCIWVDFNTDAERLHLLGTYLQFSPIISSNTLTHSQDDEDTQIMLEELKTHLF